jgi:hypothetical protein
MVCPSPGGLARGLRSASGRSHPLEEKTLEEFAQIVNDPGLPNSNSTNQAVAGKRACGGCHDVFPSHLEKRRGHMGPGTQDEVTVNRHVSPSIQD